MAYGVSKSIIKKKLGKIHSSASLLVLFALSGRSARNLRVIL